MSDEIAQLRTLPDGGETPEDELIEFVINEWEGHLILGALGLQAEDPEDVGPEDISALHELRDKLVRQFSEQTASSSKGGKPEVRR